MKLKNVLLSTGLLCAMAMTACATHSSQSSQSDTQTTVAGSEQQTTVTEVKSEESKQGKRDFSAKLNGEDGVVRWVRGHSGNLMMTMASKNGYLEEYGLKVEQIPMQTTTESFAAVAGNQVDIVSNAGTSQPLQRIATGDELKIFGGHMVEGAVFVIGRKDAEWTGVESFVGKKVAGGNAGDYVVAGPLLEMGYKPEEDVEWIKAGNAAEATTILKSGEADYAIVGTELAYQIKTDPEIKELAKYGDLMDKYSCCRMETADRFINEKPNTTKALIKALLRGMRDYNKDPEGATKLLAEELDVPVEFVQAYTLDSGYEIHPDPLYNSCVRAWAYMDELGILDENAQNINLRDYILVDLYKEALDEVIEEVGDEDPEYWAKQVEYFNEHNSMYFDKAKEEAYFADFTKRVEENKEKSTQGN